ncbi:MAG: N-acetylmuramoyl-L-alanine amidase [Oscillospiraceae bacterium]|nr:N-acetylmuramoyl-L-alanine amidase [Oscillospiraceae bacterium]
MARIWIDAGHGNTDPGAVGISGRKEADDNLKLALALNTKLQAAGHTTRMTRTTNTFAPIDRSAEANKWGTDLYITCHRNAFSDPAANGFEIYTKTAFSKTDDAAVQEIWKEITALKIFKDRGVKRYNFGSLVGSKNASVLVEYGFVTNANDNAIFDKNINALADATVKGINKVFPANVPAPVQTQPVTPANPNVTTLYRVQVGSFGVKANADNYLAQVKKIYPDAFIQEVKV